MRRISFEAWLVALVLVAHLYAALVPPNSLMEWFRSDDAFYYFKTAQNITEGRGITFDGFGLASGFHPLWMALMVPVFALARTDLMLPLRIVVMLSALLSAGTGVLLYRTARRALAALPAAFIAIFWVFEPVIHNDVTEMGLESGISAFFIALLVYRVSAFHTAPAGAAPAAETGWLPFHSPAARSLLLTGLVGALTVLARLDNVFLVLVVGIWLALRPARMRYMLTADVLLVALGVLWSYMTRIGFGAVYAQMAESQLWMLALALVLRVGLYLLFGLYRRPEGGWLGLGKQLLRAAGVGLLASVLLGGLMQGLLMLGVFQNFSRMLLIYEAGFGLAAVLAVRLLAALLDAVTTRRVERVAGGGYADDQTAFRLLPTLARAVYYFAPIGLVMAAYMGAHMAIFGTPSPVSGQIKRWWGTLPNTIYGRPEDSLAGLLGFFKRGGPWVLLRDLAAWPARLSEGARLLIYGALALSVALSQRARVRHAIDQLALFPLFTGGFLQLISYTGTGYLHMRTWYWVSSLLLSTLLLGVLLDALLHRIEHGGKLRTRAFSRSRRARHARGAGTTGGAGTANGPVAPAAANPLVIWSRRLVIIAMVLVVLSGLADMVEQMPPTVRAENWEYYRTGTAELEAATEPGAVIGSTGGGVIAYFIRDRVIVNMDGLMNTTEYFHALQSGHAAEYLDQLGLDYVFATELVVTDSDPYFQLNGHLEKISSFGGATLFYWKTLQSP